MNSAMKAAVISLGVFLAIILGYFFIASRESSPPAVSQFGASSEESEPAAATPVETPAEAGVEFRPVEVPRDSVAITVDIRENRTRRALREAYLRVMKSGIGERPGDTVYDSRTDPSAREGHFVANLVPGAYVLHAQCPRYAGERRSLTVVKETPQAVEFLLDRGNSISGKVLSSAGGGIGGARVVALKELGNPDADLEEMLIGLVTLSEMTNAVESETVSAEDGSYQLDGLEPEWYTVRAVAPEHAPNQVEEVPAPRQDVNVVLEAGGQFGGLVQDTNGSPVSGAEIKAYPHVESQNIFEVIMAKNRPPVDVVHSDSTGRFQFETLGTGVFNFLVEADGYQTQTLMRVTVQPGAESLNFTMPKGLVVAGYVEGPNGDPVVGASVRAQRVGGGARLPVEQVAISFDDGSVETNEIGRFEFNTLEDGQYSLLCFHDDYQTVRRQNVHPGQAEITIRMDHGGRVGGIVTDLAGNPIAGALVSSTDVADKQKKGVTGEDGSYLLTGVQSGSRALRVTVTAKGYAREQRDVRATVNREIEENFQLQPTGALQGSVVTDQGDPIPNVRIMVRAPQGDKAIERTVGSGFTDRNGSYLITDVESGENLVIQAKQAQYLDARSEPVNLESGGTTEVPSLVMRLGGAIAGRVLTSDGAAATGCVVSLRFEGETELEMQSNPSGATNSRGEFVIQGLESGVVDLVVKAPRHLTKEVKGVEVREGERHMVGDITLETGFSVAGVVLDRAGKPVGGASVLAVEFVQGMKELKGSTDAQGRFIVDGIQADDKVELKVTHPEYSTFEDLNVAVGSSDLQIVLGDLAKIRGFVIDERGEPLQAFTVQPRYKSERRDPRKDVKPQTFTSSGGEFVFKGISEGTYDVHVSAPSYAAATVEDVRVTEGELRDLGRITLTVGGGVYGRVIDQGNGAPVHRARVQIVQGKSRFLASAADGAVPVAEQKPVQFTDENGNFRFSGLKNGALSLRVSLQGYVTETIENVDPAAASTSQGITISLVAGGQISGVVYGADGKPRRRMPVYLMGSSPSSNQSGTTDREGRFTFRGVPPGEFTVKAHQFRAGGGGQREQAEIGVSMGPGEKLEVTLQLE